MLLQQEVPLTTKEYKPKPKILKISSAPIISCSGEIIMDSWIPELICLDSITILMLYSSLDIQRA